MIALSHIKNTLVLEHLHIFFHSSASAPQYSISPRWGLKPFIAVIVMTAYHSVGGGKSYWGFFKAGEHSTMLLFFPQLVIFVELIKLLV